MHDNKNKKFLKLEQKNIDRLTKVVFSGLTGKHLACRQNKVLSLLKFYRSFVKGQLASLNCINALHESSQNQSFLHHCRPNSEHAYKALTKRFWSNE